MMDPFGLTAGTDESGDGREQGAVLALPTRTTPTPIRDGTADVQTKIRLNPG